MKKATEKKVTTWNHEKSGINIDCYLRHTRFVATVLGEELDAPEADVLRAQVMDKLEHWMKMDWYPIIHVEVEDNTGNNYRDEPEGDGLRCKIDRFWLSRSPAGRVMQVEWDVDESHRKAKMSRYNGGYGRNVDTLELARLPMGAPYKLNDEAWLLDFSEESWTALTEIILGLGKMKAQLRKLVTSKAGVARLSAGGSKLLLGEGKK